MQLEAIASKSVLDKGEVALISVCGSDASIAAVARTSYKKGTKAVSTDEQLIRYLMRHKHMSPFEQVFVQLYFKAPIFVMRQAMRHRTWSWNEVSGRYSEIADEAYLPNVEMLTTQDARNKQARTATPVEDAAVIRDSMQSDQASLFHNYRGYLQEGLAREVARVNLPLSTYTEVVAAVDLRNLLHFLSLRYSAHAQYEIRVYAEAIYEMLKPLFPATFKAWEACELNAVTLTETQVEALRAFVRELALDTAYETQEAYDITAEQAVAGQHWDSSSEKAEIIAWLKSLVTVDK
jgi:thymidylate synthase (FAD)